MHKRKSKLTSLIPSMRMRVGSPTPTAHTLRYSYFNIISAPSLLSPTHAWMLDFRQTTGRKPRIVML